MFDHRFFYNILLRVFRLPPSLSLSPVIPSRKTNFVSLIIFTLLYFFVLLILNIHGLHSFAFSCRLEKIETRPGRVRSQEQQRGTRLRNVPSSYSAPCTSARWSQFFFNIVSFFFIAVIHTAGLLRTRFRHASHSSCCARKEESKG